MLARSEQILFGDTFERLHKHARRHMARDRMKDRSVLEIGKNTTALMLYVCVRWKMSDVTERDNHNNSICHLRPRQCRTHIINYEDNYCLIKFTSTSFTVVRFGLLKGVVRVLEHTFDEHQRDSRITHGFTVYSVFSDIDIDSYSFIICRLI